MALVFGTNVGELINLDDGVTELADEIYGFGGDDDIYGYGGNDILLGGLGFDYLDGGDGIDTVYYDDSAFAVAVDLDAGGTGGTAGRCGNGR